MLLYSGGNNELLFRSSAVTELPKLSKSHFILLVNEDKFENTNVLKTAREVALLDNVPERIYKYLFGAKKTDGNKRKNTRRQTDIFRSYKTSAELRRNQE